MLEILFWLFVVAVCYVYIGYPICLAALSLLKRPPLLCADITPTVTVIVTAYNEAARIREKLDNVLALDYPIERFDVIVGSDASDDETDAIVEQYGSNRVRLLRVEGRQGKTAVQNACVKAAMGEIVVFTDATTWLQSDSLKKLMRYFADMRVGCAAARLIYVGREGAMIGTGGSAYWAVEAVIRRLEAHASSLIGVSGCYYAVRRSLFRGVEPHLISDFVIALDTVKSGYKVVFAEEAICNEVLLSKSRQEFRMRVRVALRTYTALRARAELMNPFRYGIFAWQLFSHKVLRYGVGFMLPALLVINIAIVDVSLYRNLFVLQVVFYLTAGLAGSLQEIPIVGRVSAMANYFVLVNMASLAALALYLRGENIVVWSPTR